MNTFMKLRFLLIFLTLIILSIILVACQTGVANTTGEVVGISPRCYVATSSSNFTGPYINDTGDKICARNSVNFTGKYECNYVLLNGTSSLPNDCNKNRELNKAMLALCCRFNSGLLLGR